MTLWLLTYEVNDYNQHGAYFSAVWTTRPTKQSLIKFLGNSYAMYADEIIKKGKGGDDWQVFVLEEIEEN